MDSQVGRPTGLETLARAAYRSILVRKPTGDEIALAQDHLQEQQQLYVRANAPKNEALSKSVESLAHVLISSNVFLYVD